MCFKLAVLPTYQPVITRQLYDNPPIVERFIVVEAEQSAENFSQGILAWMDSAREFFPIEDHQTRWELQVEEIDGVPVAESAEAVAQITYVFKRLGVPQCSLVTRAGVLRMGLLRNADDGLRYEDFRPLANEWAQRWLMHFGLRPKRIAMRYINVISRPTTPQLVASNGDINISAILTAFGHVPGQFETLIPPYRCEANVLIASNDDWAFESRLKVHAVQIHESSGIAVEIQAALRALHSRAEAQVLDSLDLCHKAVNHQFECVFTPGAKAGFMPKTQSQIPSV